jgi:hypothetical protein
MNQHKSGKTEIIYYRLIKDETPPDNLGRFVILAKKRETHFQLNPHFIAAKSREDAKKIVEEDYQAPDWYGYLQQ